MKGRLTYDKVNTAVDELNKSFSGKYTLLATKRSAQTDFIKKKMVSYKEEETKDTKGKSQQTSIPRDSATVI